MSSWWSTRLRRRLSLVGSLLCSSRQTNTKTFRRNLFQPNCIIEVILQCCVRHREKLISPLNGITMNRVKSPPPPVKRRFLQNNIRKHGRAFCDGILFPRQKTPSPLPSPTSNLPPSRGHLPNCHPFVYSKIKEVGELHSQRNSPTQLSNQK